MRMNVKSPGPPFIFGVNKCDPPPGGSKIYSDPPLCFVKFMLTLSFLGRQKVNEPPLNSSGPPSLLKNECSLSFQPACKIIKTKIHALHYLNDLKWYQIWSLFLEERNKNK